MLPPTVGGRENIPKACLFSCDKLFNEDVECVVGLTDGKSVTVVEHFDAVGKLLEQAR
jgi:hypothetical protein